jgi:uncharacterized Fe-S cluster protein YjdI
MVLEAIRVRVSLYSHRQYVLAYHDTPGTARFQRAKDLSRARRARQAAKMVSMAEKQYTNGEITVVWQPEKCIHSTNCWKSLLKVFDPRKRPWVNMEGASSEQIAATIDKCPSGALSYTREDNQEPTHAS